MQQIEPDRTIGLDWVAVDPWGTDNPHTQIFLRGKTVHGQDLVLGRDFISHGMRIRAHELATAWLSPRTEQEICAHQVREITADRFAALDHALQLGAVDGVIGLRVVPDSGSRRWSFGVLFHV